MDPWLQRLTAQAAANIEHYRHVRGLTRTELANRATAAGLPTRRPALSGLLDGHRQTITLQELVVLAQVLEVTVAELVLPLHHGAPTTISAGKPIHPYLAAQQLFAIPTDSRLDRSPPYQHYARYTAAADRFAAANARLITLSHALAVGAAVPNTADGRPHPAAEILATEATLTRLVAVRGEFTGTATTPPPTAISWAFLTSGEAPQTLPVLEHTKAGDYPLFTYRLRVGALPAPTLISRAPAPE